MLPGMQGQGEVDPGDRSRGAQPSGAPSRERASRGEHNAGRAGHGGGITAH